MNPCAWILYKMLEWNLSDLAWLDWAWHRFKASNNRCCHVYKTFTAKTSYNNFRKDYMYVTTSINEDYLNRVLLSTNRAENSPVEMNRLNTGPNKHKLLEKMNLPNPPALQNCFWGCSGIQKQAKEEVTEQTVINRNKKTAIFLS